MMVPTEMSMDVRMFGAMYAISDQWTPNVHAQLFWTMK